MTLKNTTRNIELPHCIVPPVGMEYVKGTTAKLKTIRIIVMKI